MSITNCVYCNREITTRSSEHVIQNALGGLYESTDICCPECNNYISRAIDVPFTTIFNPVIGSIGDMVRSREATAPKYTGKASYKGEAYNVNLRAGKIVSCPDLSRNLRCDASRLPLELSHLNFQVNNACFRNGISKIAFSYALARGIDFSFLRDGLDVKKNNDEIENITFNYIIFPFVPTNPVDECMETRPVTQLFHNIILFSQQGYLWCYIDLFNTFQYYVMLSDKFPMGKHIYESYMQTLHRIDWKSPDKIPLINRATKSYKINMADMFNDTLVAMRATYSDGNMCNNMLRANLALYTDKQGHLRTENFRTVTLCSDSLSVISYPYAANIMFRDARESVGKYTNYKFNRLNAFLLRGKNK